MLLILNVVGLTPEMISQQTPNLLSLVKTSELRPLDGVLPAVTLSAQASILTGKPVSEHGVVGNGWLFRDTMEPRLWQQSRNLCSGEFFYEKAQKAGLSVAKLFWWFNQGCSADYSVTPKPYYSCDGNKAFGIHGTPEGFTDKLEAELGKFPFHAFWGPEAGVKSSEWIARATEYTLKNQRPDLTMAYIPHLDYDLQRFGATRTGSVTGDHLATNLTQLDNLLAPLLTTAQELECKIIILSEYGITNVNRPVFINKILNQNGFLQTRQGPFGDILETFNSDAFAVCDHQIAHVYIKNQSKIIPIKKLLRNTAGIAAILSKDEQSEFKVNHPRSGELLALAEDDSWFTWQYDSGNPPDFAATVDIHRKPGYDPAELFYAGSKVTGRLKSAVCLLRKKLGLRYRFNVISTDPYRVKGSHGLLPAAPEKGAVFISNCGSVPDKIAMTDISNYVTEILGLKE